MSFKCKKCKKQIKQGQSQFKKVSTRIYLTGGEESKPAKQISKEDLICFKCWKKTNGKKS